MKMTKCNQGRLKGKREVVFWESSDNGNLYATYVFDLVTIYSVRGAGSLPVMEVCLSDYELDGIRKALKKYKKRLDKKRQTSHTIHSGVQ